jgi:hypothetical protein
MLAIFRARIHSPHGPPRSLSQARMTPIAPMTFEMPPTRHCLKMKFTGVAEDNDLTRLSARFFTRIIEI